MFVCFNAIGVGMFDSSWYHKNVLLLLNCSLSIAILVDSNSFILDRNMHIGHEEVPLKLKSKRNGARLNISVKVRKRANIRNRYNQAPHLTQK